MYLLIFLKLFHVDLSFSNWRAQNRRSYSRRGNKREKKKNRKTVFESHVCPTTLRSATSRLEHSIAY